MQSRIFSITVLIPALLALGACASSEQPAEIKAEVKKAPEKTAGPMSGKDAYWEMYKPALQWAPDIQALSLQSEVVPGQTVADGKAAAWTAVFVSASKMEMRTITWALTPFGDYRKGMNAAQPVKWGGPTTKAKPFAMTEVTLDSDAAEKAAAEDPQGSGWLKAHPGKPLSFYLGAESRFPAPVWVVAWGTPKDADRYSKYLNAATGAGVK